MNERVFATAVWDDGTGAALYVGGVFTMAGDVEANRIARWDGDAWSPLASGLDGNVLALAVFENALVAGGLFTEAGGVAANHIARWDGGTWSPLGSGVSGFPCCSGSGGVGVRSLTVFDGALIVGGTFAEAGGVTANLVARWDGNTWSPMGAGLYAHLEGPTTPLVAALTDFDGDLIAGGQFNTLDQAGEQPANYIARWDGSAWSPLGDGMNRGVHALIERDGALIAGGRFTEAGGVEANRIARWDGKEWSTLGPPGTEILGAVILDFRELDGALIAGGTIVEAGELPVNHVARWDGGAWSALSGPAGTGVSGPIDPVSTLTLFDGDLIVGGRLTEAGGIPVGRIARWNGERWSPLGPFTFLAVTPDPLDFGWAIVGETTAPQSVTLMNVGTTDITVTGVSDPEAPFASAGGTCDAVPFVLTPEESCELSFTFSPMAAGPFSATVTLTSDTPSNPDTVTLQGIGSEEPLNIQPETLDFGIVVVDEVGGPLSVNLTNADSVDINISTVNGPAPPFTAAGGTCGPAPFSLAPSASCTLAYTFDPTATGSFSDTVEVISDASSSPDSFGLEGEAVQRELTIQPDLLDFGTVGIGETSDPLSVTLSNTGGAEIAIDDVSDPGTPFSLLDSTCGTTLPTEASCTLVYSFSPIAPGDVTTTVTITSNAPSSPDTVSLQGTGTGPAIDVDPESFTVVLEQGEATTELLTLGNLRDAVLTWSIETAEPDSVGVGVVDCEGEPGLVIHDDGTIESGYPPPFSFIPLRAFVDRFTPGAYPAALHAVCLSFFSVGPSALSFEIVVFDDDGADGGPGTELGALAVSAEDIPQPGQPLPPDLAPVWFDYDISSLGISVDSGSVYIGARWTPPGPLPDVFLASDESPDRPAGFAGGYTWNSNTDIWAPSEELFSGYRSLFVRAVVDPGGCVDPSTVPWLSVDPSSGSTPAEGTSSVQVTIDAEDLDSGDYTASLCIESSDPIRPLAVVPVHLMVTTAPVTELTFDPSSLEFGDVEVGTTSPPQTATLHNTGNTDATGVTFTGLPDNGFEADTSACGDTLPAGGSCSISVSFTPLAAGPAAATLHVGSNEDATADLEFSGNGIGEGGPIVDISPESLAFEVPPGDSDTQTLNIGNIGDADLDWSIDEAETGLLPETGSYAYGFAGAPAFHAPTGFDRASGIGGSLRSAPADPVVLPAPQPLAVGELDEGFDDITTLPGAGWALINNSEPIGPSSWFQGNETIFPSHEGDPDAYIAANFESTDDVGTISNWLITPEVTIVNGTQITFWTRTTEQFEEFFDRLEVRMSVEGESVDVGDTAESVGDFTELLLTINPDLEAGEYPEEWTQFVLTVRERSRQPITGRFAFRYWVTDSGPNGSNGDYIGIDTVSVTQPGDGVGCANPIDVPWLSFIPAAGTTSPDDSVPVSVTVNATDLEEGEHTAQLCVNTNDPNAPLVEVPVTLTVVMGQDIWEPLDTGTTQDLHAVHFVDDDVGYVAGASGTVLKTTDGGETWEEVSPDIDQDLYGVYFFDAELGVVVGSAGTIERTINGGADWTSITSGTSETLYDVSFGDSVGLTVGSALTILRSENQGESWEEVQGDFFDPGFFGVDMLDDSVGFVAGQNAIFQPLFGFTSDGGLSFDVVPFYFDGNEGWLEDVRFIDALQGNAVGVTWDAQGAIALTEDGGQEWSTTLFSDPLYAVDFITGETGYAVGAMGTMLKTTDGGETWEPEQSGTAVTLNAISIPTPSTGYAAGSGGTVLKGSITATTSASTR